MSLDSVPYISVIMAVYNTPFSLVSRALQSVINQDFDNWELIIIDDGSTNETSLLLYHLAKKHEDRITLIRHGNCGQSKSINKGISISNGQYIAILDADDEYMPHHLSTCLLHIKHVDLIASTTITVVDSEDDYYVPDKLDPTKLIHVDDCVLLATLFGDKKVFTRFPLLDGYAADAQFFEMASNHFRVKKVDLRSYIYYRNVPGSICSHLKTKNKLEIA